MNYTLRNIACIVFLAISFSGHAQQKAIWQNRAFAFYPDSIVQGPYTATAISTREIISNYESPANLFQSPAITFKFSINRKDNEMKPGVDHRIHCINGNAETPLITFGKQFTDTTVIPKDKWLEADSKLTIRLDMREVLAEIKKQGYFTTYNGSRIYAADFKAVYVAGATAPMMWDFDNLYQRPELQMKDPDGDGIYETSMILNETKKEKELAASWKLSKDISAFPQYQSGYRLSDALYNMAIEEMIRAVEPYSTFRTGKEWAGVWTTEISYSMILAIA